MFIDYFSELLRPKSLPVSLAALVSVFFMAPAAASTTMQALDEEEMAEVSGAGIAVALDDFSFAMAPTSFIELTGRATALPQWDRGDARYYGLTISGGQTGAGTGTDWRRSGSPSCLQGNPVGCPIGLQGANDFAPVGDPYVFRSFQYEGYDFQGNFRSGTVGPNAMPTVLELIGPSNMDRWRWSFWGEIEVDRGGGSNSGLQSQSIINGRNATKDGTPTIVRVVKTQDTADPTLGILYQSALSGDFRFSVGQEAGSPAAWATAREQVPNFNAREGMYFRDVDAYLPMGRLHSQALVADTVGTDGDFRLTLTPIPNIPAVYNDIYCGNAGGCATVIENVDFFDNPAGTRRRVIAIANPNAETHGYVRWGDFGRTYTAANNGVYFQDRAGTRTHLGVARFEGMLIQYLNIETLGAGGI